MVTASWGQTKVQSGAPGTCPQQGRGVSGLQGGGVEPSAREPPAGPSRAWGSASLHVPWSLEPEAATPLPSGHSQGRE